MAQRVDGDGHVHARVDEGEFLLLVRGEVQNASFILAQIEWQADERLESVGC